MVDRREGVEGLGVTRVAESAAWVVPEPVGRGAGDREPVEIERLPRALGHWGEPAVNGVGQAVADVEGADDLVSQGGLPDPVGDDRQAALGGPLRGGDG